MSRKLARQSSVQAHPASRTEPAESEVSSYKEPSMVGHRVKLLMTTSLYLTDQRPCIRHPSRRQEAV